MNVIRIILLLFSITIYCQELENSDTLNAAVNQPSAIELKTYLVKNKVPLNRSVEFYLELSWIGDMSRYQIIQIPQPVLTNLIMEGSGSANRLEELSNGMYRSSKSITYKFSPVTLGMAYIDGLEVKYRDQKTGNIDVLYSQRVSVEIIDPLPDDFGNGFQAFIYVVLLVIFFGAVFYFLVLFLKRRKQAKKVSEPESSLAEQYLKKLTHDIDPRGTNLKEMTMQLDRLSREYLSKEYNIPARETSTKELIHYLQRAGLEETTLKRMEELFDRFDMIKFAGGDLDPAEFSNMYGIVENFLHERKKTWEAEKVQTKED